MVEVAYAFSLPLSKTGNIQVAGSKFKGLFAEVLVEWKGVFLKFLPALVPGFGVVEVAGGFFFFLGEAGPGFFCWVGVGELSEFGCEGFFEYFLR